MSMLINNNWYVAEIEIGDDTLSMLINSNWYVAEIEIGEINQILDVRCTCLKILVTFR